MNRLLIIFCLFLTSFCLSSCETGSSGSLPSAFGGTGELLVVMHDYLWKGASGDSIRKYLTEPVWGLTTAEPVLELTQKNSLTQFMRKFRNILIVNVDAGLENSNLRVRNNVYANNQVVFNLDAPSPDSIVSIVQRNKDIITSLILTKGRDAIISDYTKIIEKSIVEQVKEKFMIDIVIPRPYVLDEDRENFAWIAREEGEKNWHILLWEEPYLRTSQLETTVCFSV